MARSGSLWIALGANTRIALKRTCGDSHWSEQWLTLDHSWSEHVDHSGANVWGLAVERARGGGGDQSPPPGVGPVWDRCGDRASRWVLGFRV